MKRVSLDSAEPSLAAISKTSQAGEIAGDSLTDLLRRLAYAQLPSRFHSVAQLGFPLAYQLWSWGWHRSAGWLTAIALFSLWALAEQHLTGRADSEIHPVAENSKRLAGWRFLRSMSATTGFLITLTLILEGFAQILSSAFNCPGCAG
jgi:hypothetical protein